MTAYYNEIDPFAAAWLRELIKNKHIAPGDVDERDIREVTPEDLSGYSQCHFFAGIGGWSLALRMAGWPDDLEVWTGSPPCQPFSSAGNHKGINDERHLWPDYYRLIQQRSPAIIFGEQVSSKDGLTWLDIVQNDLENEGYSVAPLDLCASGVGTPHPRQRTYVVADSGNQRVPRPSSSCGTSQNRPWGAFGSEDLQSVYESPESDGRCFPKPLLRSMDDGLSQRMGRLRGYGNAIVPQLAAEFIASFMEVKNEQDET